ncbi:PREDICTED: DNA mismatch repair protein Mlh3-like [Dufourea novaeangliae]|uniref:DNA mismatch repair protein Mlh3-like n=1 Tax=Dufourea novaeangliae TaxID=178035 RepID=UPI000767506D|nr:PREDICTED: DNA mismatch repair protein Mlh3-like [Dufourea novaeangliae]
MDTSIVATSNVTNLAECVLELVLNSLKANATSIAIRFHTEIRKIQVVDNGIGISREKLNAIAEYNAQNEPRNVQDICNSNKQTLANIRRFSDALIITSRRHKSSKTYMKVFKVCCAPKIIRVQRRPSIGTTVSIYGFHELSFDKWNILSMYLLVGNIAIVNLQVSFSIRDDQGKKVIMIISKPHKPIEIFKSLYRREVSFNNVWYIENVNEDSTKFCAFIGLANTKLNARQYIFLNNRPVHCPLILQVISTAFITILRSSVQKTNNFDSTTLFHKHYDFLPKKLHKLLCGNTKLTKTDVLIKSGGSVTSSRLKSGLQIPDTLLHHEMVVRPCKAVQRLREFRLKKELLEFVEILGQVRNEFIVGLAIQNDWKVLLLMDQHAIHERIRYENLLHKYKSQTRNQLLSTKLRDPIVIQLPVDKCNLLISNKIQLKRFGISFIAINDSTMAVHTVPECLKKDRYYDEVKLKFNLQSLLNEILQYFTKDKHHGLNDLPHTIHNAIAMEACHGAIKFGDPLTLQQCKWLLKLLKKTKIPTRCAHGRPSVVPILELSELDKWNKKSCQVCKHSTYYV